MNEKMDAGASAIAADLVQLRDDVAHMRDTLAALVRSESGHANAIVRNAVDGAKNQVSHAADNAHDGALATAADFERRIEKNPLTAVLIASGIGFALGAMSRARG